MTVISESNVRDIAGADDTTQFEFTANRVGGTEVDTSFLTPRPYFMTAVDGVLTTPDFAPGPALVRVGLRTYAIVIPDSATPVRLGPLIEAGLPIPAADTARAVINAGGISRRMRVTVSEYAALVTPDPETEYSVVPDPT